MSDEFNQNENDPESISFVGFTSSPPEAKIDFSQKIWLLEFYFTSNIVQFTVNAETEEEALTKAIAQAKQRGILTATVERIVTTELEVLGG